MWGFFVSTVLVYHAVFLVNSVCHLFGRRRYATHDHSRNNAWVALATFGEGWHNNHHYYQSSTNQGFFWWEIDISYYLLRLLGILGIVWDIRKPPQAVLMVSSGADARSPTASVLGATHGNQDLAAISHSTPPEAAASPPHQRSLTMSVPCDIIIQWSATPRQLAALGSALWRWCNRTAGNTSIHQWLDNQPLADLLDGKLPVSNQLPLYSDRRGVHFRVSDRVSPQRQATLDDLRRELPTGGIEDVVVDGISWNSANLAEQADITGESTHDQVPGGRVLHAAAP